VIYLIIFELAFSHIIQTSKNLQMNSQSLNQKLFIHESINQKMNSIHIRELKVINQFDQIFAKSIQEFKTAESICGYVVSAVAPIIAKSLSYSSTVDEIEEIMTTLNDYNIMIPKVENNMRIVQQQRARYIEQNPDEFNHEEEKTAYIKDYVAKYEISDLMQILGSDLENLVFLRHVGYEFPELVADLKHEEKKKTRV